MLADQVTRMLVTQRERARVARLDAERARDRWHAERQAEKPLDTRDPVGDRGEDR